MQLLLTFSQFLSNHAWLLLIAGIELLAASFLFCVSVKRWVLRPFSKQARGAFQTELSLLQADKPGFAEQQLLKAFNEQTDSALLLLRREDLLPMAAGGDPEALLRVSFSEFREDVSRIFSGLADPDEGRRLFQRYRDWDGTGEMTAVLALPGEEWTSLHIRRTKDQDYDLFLLRRCTEEQKALESMRQSLAAEEENSQSKTSFLSRMSHEIRTPMNGIIGMLTLAKGRLAEDAQARRYLDQAAELSDHMLALINDILDMSRIEAGKVELETAPFSLRALGQKLYDMFSGNLQTKGVHYSVDFEDVEADWLLGDELRISQVIINFLSNAVKFTSEGEVTVTFRQMMQKAGVADISIKVHDTGIGMKPEFISRIFRPFEQESIETGHRYGGTGLGMAITDQLVKLMGGEIVVESQPGKGSDFTVYLSLPIAEAKEETAKPEDGAEAAGIRGCRILMAEDNEINAMIAEEILRDKGAEVETVENGRLAVEQFAAHPAGYYDVILMDIQMPEMDGRSATREIRALPRADAAQQLIFGLSADAFVEDERLSLECGMNGHIGKPVDFDALEKRIGAALQKRS